VQNNNLVIVNGTKLYYEVAGKGEALILLHSGYTDSRLWDYQFELFSKYFKVIRYDIRGFGRSDRPEQSFSHIEDLRGLLSNLDIDKTHLVGVSMGGSIAIDFTIQYPEMVDSLVLSGPSINGFKPNIDEASQRRSLMGISIVKGDDELDKSIEFMLDDPMWRQCNPRAHNHLKKMFQETSLEWLLDTAINVQCLPSYNRISEINNRTLLIIGSEDSQPIKEIGQELEVKIATLKSVIINDTGHLPNLDKPEIFNKLVLHFLTDSRY
jgi:pimeloyl-ACP methyl ester carboxylesterase